MITPNLAPIIDVPYRFLDKLFDVNLYLLSKETLQRIRDCFVGYEPSEDKKTITYFFKSFKDKEDPNSIIKGFTLDIDWTNYAITRKVKVPNIEQVRVELNEFLHFQFEYNKELVKEFEYFLCEKLCHAFLIKSLGNYLTDLTDIPCQTDFDDLDDIGMHNALEINPRAIYIETSEWCGKTKVDNWKDDFHPDFIEF